MDSELFILYIVRNTQWVFLYLFLAFCVIKIHTHKQDFLRNSFSCLWWGRACCVGLQESWTILDYGGRAPKENITGVRKVHRSSVSALWTIWSYMLLADFIQTSHTLISIHLCGSCYWWGAQWMYLKTMGDSQTWLSFLLALTLLGTCPLVDWDKDKVTRGASEKIPSSWGYLSFPEMGWIIPTKASKDTFDKEMATQSSMLAGKIHGQKSLTGCNPWGRRELGTA